MVGENTGAEQLLDGGIIGVGIEVAHEDERVLLVAACPNGFEYQLSGFDPRRLAAVIPVGVLDIDGASFFGASQFDQPRPGADSSIAVTPSPAVGHVRGVGEPESAVLFRVEFPDFSIIENGGVFSALFAVFPADTDIAVIGQCFVDVEQLPIPDLLQSDNAGFAVAKIAGEHAFSLLPVPCACIALRVLADIVGDDVERCNIGP